ncbi:MAG: FCD domain-containing protein, partial [Cutibacterium sp.]|nr:FCD domain-containing protein [Cutibacterium sp.]
RSDWNVLHPRVIRWGLEGRRRPQTLEWISQLRAAVEPVAAAMACTRATQQDSITMSVAATRMTHAAAVRDLEAYLIADEEFHSTLLSASGNPMFATLRHSVSSLLEGRTELMPFEPNLQAIAWHREVADAVAARNPDDAQAAMLNIVEEALDAMKQDLPRNPESS